MFPYTVFIQLKKQCGKQATGQDFPLVDKTAPSPTDVSTSRKKGLDLFAWYRTEAETVVGIAPCLS